MRPVLMTFAALACACLASPTPAGGGGGWVNYTNATATRMPTPLNDPATSTADPEEKDYAWGDVDNDGDTDLIVVRKQPFTSTGKRVNVLFMNEGIADGHAIDGILVDRTDLYATDSDVPGDFGFQTPTNDRDVVTVDVNNDGWLDVVTATTLTDNQAKHLSHPRVYMNQGEVAGVWQGFRYEDARIPQMHPTAGPRFCSVAAGDLTGNGFADLYFGDYDSGGAQIFDFNNRLLINGGNGFFTDETASRLTTEMSLSAFGAASIITDMNGNGVLDVVKQTSLSAPQHVAITYNDPTNQGFFNFYDVLYSLAPYFVSAGDLNGDGKMDLVITDDGTDRYLLNTGNDGAGHAQFTQLTFPNSGGFGSNSVVADLNNDGHNDVIIADVDVDIPGCSRRTFIYRNLGNVPNVSFQEQGQVIPDAMLTGVHDVAVFDIDGDGWKDLVLGRCSGTQVWMNVPPVGLVFAYPNGLPAFLTPGQPYVIDVQVSAIGGGQPASGTGRMSYSINGAPFVEQSMEVIGQDLYRGVLPAVGCTEDVRFFFSADLQGGGTFTDPPNAPGASFNAIAADGTQILLRDEIEGDTSGWTIISQGLASGEWEQADPVGTLFNGAMAAPDDDATQGAENILAFVTQNGAPGDPASASDVDGGPTRLISPAIDVAGTDALISYARWFFTATGVTDRLTVDVSNDDGASWTPIPAHTTGGTGGSWETVSFRLGDYVLPTSTVRVRFSAMDNPNDSITEGGIDNFQVEVFVCAPACPVDLNGDAVIDVLDLLELLAAWGPCPGCPPDFNGDDAVDVLDLLDLLAAWGPCP